MTKTTKCPGETRRSAIAAVCGLLASALLATVPDGVALAAGKPTVRMLINQSPWLDSFITMVDRYQLDTGNKIDLDVVPFGGMQEKARNSLRGASGNYDLLALNSAGMAEIYGSGLLRPIGQLDPAFRLPDGVLDFGGSAYWNFEKRSFDPKGQLLGVPINGNVQVLYYRTDLYQKAGLKVPNTWDELLANGKALNNPSKLYGFVPRAARDSILYNFTPYLFSYGGGFFADPKNGDYSVTLANPAGLKALEMYIRLGKEAGPPNFGAIAQAELIQLLATGKAAQAVAVIAAYSQLQDPSNSAVAGEIGVAVLPAGPDGKRSSAAGHWMAGIAANVPQANQTAALDFLKWFVTRDHQIAYVEAGGVPIRHDLSGGGIEKKPAFAFLPAFSENAANSQMNMPLEEGNQIGSIIAVYLNRAVIGELTPTDALNGAAEETHKILVKAGYKVRPPSKL